MPKLLVPFSDHFPGRVTYRGSSTLNHIKTGFLELGLLERAKESPFKQFFLALEFNFSGVLVHQLLLRKIASNNEDEVHFFLGSKSCRFGMGEFALVMGLDFSAFPSPEELEGRNLSDRLIKEYFNDAEKVKLSQVDHAFKTCTVVEDVYKLGVCLFVEGVLNAIEGKLHIWRDILKIVENVEYFFSYPWGNYSYRRLLHSCKKDMVKQKANYDAKKDAKVQQESKYSMYGYAPALQYWAYEAIQQLAVELVVSSGNMFPRMLSWSHRRNKDFTKSVIAPILLKKNLIVLPMLKPRPAEKDYYLSLTEGDLPLYPGLGQDPSETDEEDDATFEKMAEKVSQAAEAAKIFVDAAPGEEVAGPTPPIAPASAPASTCAPTSAPTSAPASTCAPTSAPASVSAPTPTPTPASASASAPELADLIERLDRVEGRQETLLKNQSVILDVLSQILTFVKEKLRGSNEDSESESLDIPLDYVDDPTTPPTIIVTPDAETPGVVIVNPEDIAGVQFQRARRQRRKPNWFEDYTDPTRKRPRTAAAAPADEATQEATHVLDPLKKPDPNQYRTMCKWLLGDMPNKTPRDVKTGSHGPAWFLTFSSKCCSAIFNITSSQALSQGQTLVSFNQVFELGFFSPNNSANKYVGIWYKQILPLTVVWVANRDNPLTVADSPPSLTIGSNGNLELLDRNNNSVWSTNVEIQSNNSSVAILSDYGNLILKYGTQYLWESFKHSGDTFLPGAELGFNVKTGESFVLTSWKSNSDPSVGKFTAGISKVKPPQAVIWINGSTPLWRSGPWAKTKFTGIPDMDTSYGSYFNIVEDTEEGTILLQNNWDYNNSDMIVENLFITSRGVLTVALKKTHEGGDWNTKWKAPATRCDIYGTCGPFGVCNDSESPICKCLKGFEPKSFGEWSKGNWTGGCMRRNQLSCDKNTTGLASRRGKSDGFLKIGGVKLPDLYEYIEPMESCQGWCLNNCSCIAYANIEGIGCLVWSKGLIDIKGFPYDAENLFLRLPHAELGEREQRLKIIISLATLSTVGTIVAIVLYLWRRRERRKGNTMATTERIDMMQSSDNSKDDPSELPSFDFGTILHVTNNFSSTNKLGQGGFGSVYKGKLPDGREIAVKRLSSSSGQGTEEFKNELILISKLQHRNLVRLLGCCIEKEEKLLVYEFMQNKSLDNFIFDPRGREQLNWGTRVNIILGVARGLLYLHRDSSLRVIHRDLKASNILLDEKMNPKISDFGLARIFEGTLDLANTQRVVGTLGYMSPEYAMGGVFSEKSDAFSFGVLILEIVSGKKNSNFHYYEKPLSLIAHAWQLWSDNRGLDFVDDALGGSCSATEAIRCVHVGLLCVQDLTTDRPSMADVVFMLSNETNRPQPIQPIFTLQSSPLSQKAATTCSVNEATISMIEGR
ncbi:G-type lectin S-receptor-like serine/threonine-protein kinase At1g61550 [Humulus lupulus]|uniref:G-type lectin S-receptor-like serine/threonine-protein kinase At1g61550 n=1 Tax=Humulus lupulus TaxID=3486 RepID=UPI002B411D65|nr:G-type lectin S-receptor-like serine/threonine-protein kinase At1g61550 [Humulus lupulus]